jgi:hypothetical protein
MLKPIVPVKCLPWNSEEERSPDFSVAQVHEYTIWWKRCICLETSEFAPFCAMVREIFQDNGFFLVPYRSRVTELGRPTVDVFHLVDSL